MTQPLVLYKGTLWSILAEAKQFGIRSLTLAGLPRRAFTDAELRSSLALVEHFVDAALAKPIPTFSAALRQRIETKDSWLTGSRKAQQLLLAWFLICEDKQGRLRVQDVSPLKHQLSLVKHVLNESHLRRVLVGDEVGLGKTVEAALLCQSLLTAQQDLRVLYLSPARLVPNVISEFRRMELDARAWVAGNASDARLDSDRIIVASIQKAVREKSTLALLEDSPWDILIVDECHHLSDWEPGGGSPNAGYRLVTRLLEKQRPDRGRLILLSGTPHQGNQARFENILALLRQEDEGPNAVAGRVIYRTKESIRDWDGRPLFPKREVRPPRLAPLGDQWSSWYSEVGSLYSSRSARSESSARAGSWAKGQALQWVASSVHAGLGFLVRLAIRRLNWGLEVPELEAAISALRPYRGGRADEPLAQLYARIIKQIQVIEDQEDAEELDSQELVWRPDPELLAQVLGQGTELSRAGADREKWDIMERILREAEAEKVVLFCQPVETVGVVVREIEARFGQRAAIIIGGQDDLERNAEVAKFRDRRGAQFLVSSRAGGEGLNLQVSRRLLHLDIPWNPMDLEQRVGRVHRFGSRRTIIVETIVVPGTREADAYRIARSKLRMIAGQLDPEQFEMLFSRVMSLVPPEELADVFDVDLPWAPDGETDQRIAGIVRSGYDKFHQFESEYSEGARNIGLLDAGDATWEDLREFLRKACNANDAEDGLKPIFSLEGDDIIANEAAVRTINVFGKRYVCDETDGLPCTDREDRPLSRLGMESSKVLSRIRELILDYPNNRLGAVRIRRQALDSLTDKDRSITIFYALQSLTFNGGVAQEVELELRAFIADEGMPVREVPSVLVSTLVRDIVAAERQSDPAVEEDIHEIERASVEAVAILRASIDHASVSPTSIWPLACILVARG